MKGAPLRLSAVLVRGLGGLMIAAGLWLYDDALPHPLIGLALPALFAAGLLLLLRNLAAVCLGTGLLALTHTDLNGDWMVAIAYPLIAITTLGGSAYIYCIRFQQRIRNTHGARWRSRRQ